MTPKRLSYADMDPEVARTYELMYMNRLKATFPLLGIERRRLTTRPYKFAACILWERSDGRVLPIVSWSTKSFRDATENLHRRLGVETIEGNPRIKGFEITSNVQIMENDK